MALEALIRGSMAAAPGPGLIYLKAAVHAVDRMDAMLVDSGTLAEHHRRCDELFAVAHKTADDARWEQLGARVNALREAILAHFRYEEEHVFPLYEQWSSDEGATEWLCAQHDDMRATLWMLGTLSAEAEPQRYRGELAALQDAFDVHAAEEESRMYPVFERMLGR